MEHVIWDIISLSLLPMFAYPWLRFLYSGDKFWIVFATGMIISELATKGIKQLTKTFGQPFLRPKGARGCNIFCSDGLVEGRPGFVSGHCSSTSFFFTFLFLHTRNPQMLVIGSIAIILMSLARFNKKCHNVFQIVSGNMFGMSTAILWYNVFHSYIVSSRI